MSDTKPNALPSHAPVVVIGGGIMGCSTLYHLAKMGVTDAILLERNALTSGTTWHSAAQVRALRHSQNLTRMIQYSVDLYSQLEAETGQSVGWIQKGSLSLATTPDRLIHIKRQEDLARTYGIDARSISVDEARERWPLMRTDDVLGAVWSPDDGRVSPSDVCAALVKAAKALGARIFEHTAVTGVITEGNRVKGVETTAGTVRCDALALCAGLWSREIADMAGTRAPLLACEHFYLLTRPIEGISGNMPTLSDHDSHLYIRDDSGGLLVGCFEPRGKPIKPGTLDKDFAFGLLPEDWDHFEPMMLNALHRLPPLEHAEVKTLLNGPESFTPDGTFMLGETSGTKGLFLGCGMNSVGLASGGGAGMNLAHCIVHGHTAYDLGDTDARRFAPVFNSVEHLMARAPEVLGTHYDIAYPGKQFVTARNLTLLPVHTQHLSDNAHFAQSDSWERPVYFNKTHEPELRFSRADWHEQVAVEVQAANTRAALFDASSFGKFDVSGPDAEAFMCHCCSGHVDRNPGTVSYNGLLNARGTFESDLVVLRVDEDRYRLIVGTAHRWKDWSHLQREREAGGFNVSLTDHTESQALFSLAGPQALAVARSLPNTDLPDMPYFQHKPARIAGIEVIAARLSYVGERGVEISCNAADAMHIYTALRGAGATPAGLYAQTSMRIEKGFCAMGHELDSDISPPEVGLGFSCRPRGGYLGADAVQAKTDTPSRVRTLVFDNPDAVPIGHEPVVQGGRIIGQTTSAAYGHRVGRPVAMALVSGNCSATEAVDVIIAGETFSVSLHTQAAYDPMGERMKEPTT